MGEDAQPQASDPVERDASSMLTIRLDDKTIWQVIGAILFTLAALWAVREMSGLLLMLGLAFFFSLALQPAVLWLVERFEWRRGTAVGVIYLTGIVVATLMILVLIPAITELARRIGESGGAWLNSFNTWIDDMLGTHLTNPNGSTEIAKDVDKAIADWARGAGGHVLGVAASGITMVFNLATIAMFTFYFTVDAPRFQRTILSHMSPERQRRVGWTWDEAIRQTGGYFYSRLVLMVINGTGFFFTMVVVGMPVAFAIPLAAFGGFVSVFIPAVGTYIGGAVPIMVTLAIQGWTAGLVVLGYVLIYQQVENYWLSPKISSKSMSINGAVAFGAAIAGGALAGPMGAFVALPVAALVIAFMANFTKSYEVVYDAAFDGELLNADEGQAEATADDAGTSDAD